MKCEICGKEQAQFINLSAHIRQHKLNKKEYYDKYLKKDENEGRCKCCSEETTFIGLGKGYALYCSSKKCMNSDPEKREKNSKTLDIKFKELREDKDNLLLVTCQICDKKVKNLAGLTIHLTEKHLSYSLKDYYEKYLKNDENEGKCKVCNNETTFISLENGYNKYCSSICTSRDPEVKERKRKGFIENYGGIGFASEELMNKFKNTIKDKYSIDHVMHNEEIKNKCIQTNIKNNGGFGFASEKIFEKYKNTIRDKYGVDNVSQNEEIKQKKKDTFLIHYLPKVKKYLDYLDLELVSEYKNTTEEIEVKCKKCNMIFKTEYRNLCQCCRRCPKCYPIAVISSQQIDINNFIKSMGIDIIENYRGIIKSGKELDIYIPSLNIAIEYDGIYWHSEYKISDPLYHLNKTVECEEQNIRLIHIFGDEWLFKQEIVKARLRQILKKNNNEKIYARKCIIKEIDYKTKSNFLDMYHLQGDDTSKIYLGAFYNNELVSVMTFGHGSISKGSKSKDNVWELNRFCSNFNYNIIGIASKLLSYFKTKYNWIEIFSYADRRWSDGNLYYKLGFGLNKITKPNYWYVKNSSLRIHRFNLRKRPDEPKDIPEKILRIQEGYSRIWDCGNYKFIIKKEEN